VRFGDVDVRGRTAHALRHPGAAAHDRHLHCRRRRGQRCGQRRHPRITPDVDQPPPAGVVHDRAAGQSRDRPSGDGQPLDHAQRRRRRVQRPDQQRRQQHRPDLKRGRARRRRRQRRGRPTGQGAPRRPDPGQPAAADADAEGSGGRRWLELVLVHRCSGFRGKGRLRRGKGAQSRSHSTGRAPMRHPAVLAAANRPTRGSVGRQRSCAPSSVASSCPWAGARARSDTSSSSGSPTCPSASYGPRNGASCRTSCATRDPVHARGAQALSRRGRGLINTALATLLSPSDPSSAVPVQTKVVARLNSRCRTR
jgi:hypothetical protein